MGMRRDRERRDTAERPRREHGGRPGLAVRPLPRHTRGRRPVAQHSRTHARPRQGGWDVGGVPAGTRGARGREALRRRRQDRRAGRDGHREDGPGHPRHGHDTDPLERQAASAHLLAAVTGGARHRERALRVVALERLGEIGLVEFAAATLPGPERGRAGREALDQPVAHCAGGLEADAAACRAPTQGQHEDEALGVGHPGLARQLARAEDPVGGAGERPAAVAAEAALPTVPGLALLDDNYRASAGAAIDLVGRADRVVERRHAYHVPDGLDRAAALGLTEVRHFLLEVEDQVFGVHAAPIIAVYGVNNKAPWGHMYVNPGLPEP